ncbi:hypothetical protein HNP84_002868 [Thermocatellispora tengchongensis]|uniref:NADP-dependent oxidoreductase domain-containing protein n=1 Tax=Thermocatellispora tengchongensis TaxID=1073253 RepID=A0A840P7F5_9ACTN|nr:aldo/keto reductase [Thermocatellispora tengchongensis]MBB5133147.1 hypothetical protein [Thermocatellispora tengchongensis]
MAPPARTPRLLPHDADPAGAGSPRLCPDTAIRHAAWLGPGRVVRRAAGPLYPADTPFAESFGGLAELWRRGLLRHLGLSGATTARLAEARATAPVVAVQNRFHIFDRSGAGVPAACEAGGIAFTACFPLAAGMLCPGMAPSPEQHDTLDEIAAWYGGTRGQVAPPGWSGTRRSGQPSWAPPLTLHLEENIVVLDLTGFLTAVGSGGTS